MNSMHFPSKRSLFKGNDSGLLGKIVSFSIREEVEGVLIDCTFKVGKGDFVSSAVDIVLGGVGGEERSVGDDDGNGDGDGDGGGDGDGDNEDVCDFVAD